MTISIYLANLGAAVVVLGLAVYLPGRLLLRGLDLTLDPLEHLTASAVGGSGLFTFAYWLLCLVGWPGGIWIYVIASVGLEAGIILRERRRWVRVPLDGNHEPGSLLRAWPLGLLMLAGMAAQGWFMVTSAWPGPHGMMLWTWHTHDAPWHVFNLLQLSRTFPPEMPGFSGEALRNYHYFSDLFWGGVLRLVPLDPWHVYLRIAPFWYSGCLTLTVFIAARAWSGKERVAYLAAVMTVFLSTFGYVPPLLFGPEKYFFWDSIFWVQSPVANIFNPGVSSSYGFLFLGLWALTRWLRERKGPWLVLLALAWGVMTGYKIYPALLVMGALLVTGLARLVLNRERGLLVAFTAVLPPFLAIFFHANLNAPSLVRFLPGFNLATMLVAPDRLALMSSTALKLMYADRPWLVAALLAALLPVFIVGNLGVRSLALAPMVRAVFRPRAADPILLFITVLCGGALAGAVLFVQSGVQWNTIQFFYFAVAVAALPAAQQFWRWVDPIAPRARTVWVAVLICLGLPCTLQSWARTDWGFRLEAPVADALHWLGGEAAPGARVLRPVTEVLQTDAGFAQWLHFQARGRMTSLRDWRQEAETFRSGSASGTTPTANAAAVSNAPKVEKISPLGWYDSTWVAAFTGCNTFLEDTTSAQIMGYPVAERVRDVRAFYASASVIEARTFLETHRITYVLARSGDRLPFDPAGVPMKQVFQNQAIVIYKYLSPRGW